MDTASDRQRLAVVVDGTERLLVNGSDVGATYVAYVTLGSIWDYPREGDVTTTSAPCFVVRDIPAGHGVVIEEVDPFEPGHLSFTVVRAEWADGQIDVGLDGDPPRRLPQTATSVAGRAERDVVKVDVVPGRVSRGLLDSGVNTPYAVRAPAPTCLSCVHVVDAVATEQGHRCGHRAHSPHDPEGTWPVPDQWYSCPLHQPRDQTSAPAP